MWGGREGNEAGAVAVLVAISATVLFVLAALVVDLGLARDTRRQSQNTADASALAAANALYPASNACTLVNPNGAKVIPCYADAAKAAKEYASKNWGITDAQWATCADSGGYWYPAGYSPCITFADSTLSKSAPLSAPTKVRVVTPTADVKTSLGVLAGVSNVEIVSSARATLTPAAAASCSICVIGPGSHDVKNLEITVATGDIQVNGSTTLANKGGYKAPGGTVKLQEPAPGPSKGTITSPKLFGQAQLPDPFENLAAPAFPTTMIATTKNNLCGGPGVYINPTFSGCTALPKGLYVIIGGTMNPNGISAPANTFYFTCNTQVKSGKTVLGYTPRACSSGEAGANYDLTGGGATSLIAPTAANQVGNAVPGMVLWYDQKNTAEVKLTGHTGLNITGTIYMKSGRLYVGGTADASGLKAQVVVGDLAGNGDATFKVGPDSNYEYKVQAGDPALDQ